MPPFSAAFAATPVEPIKQTVKVAMDRTRELLTFLNFITCDSSIQWIQLQSIRAENQPQVNIWLTYDEHGKS